VTPVVVEEKDVAQEAQTSVVSSSHDHTSLGYNKREYNAQKIRTEKTKRVFSVFNMSLIAALLVLILWQGRSNSNRGLASTNAQNALFDFNMAAASLTSQILLTSLYPSDGVGALDARLGEFSSAFSTYESVVVRSPKGRDYLERISPYVSLLVQHGQMVRNGVALPKTEFIDASSSFRNIASETEQHLKDVSRTLEVERTGFIWFEVLICIFSLPVVMILSEVGRIQDGVLDELKELAVTERVFSIETLLEDPIGSILFANYARSVFAEEGILFYGEAKTIMALMRATLKKSSHSRESLLKLVESVCKLRDDFFNSGSIHELNIPSGVRKGALRSISNLENAMNSDAPANFNQLLQECFENLDNAFNECLEMMKPAIYSPFLRSDEFNQFLDRRKRMLKQEKNLVATAPALAGSS